MNETVEDYDTFLENRHSNSGFWFAVGMSLLASMLLIVGFGCCGLLFYMVKLNVPTIAGDCSVPSEYNYFERPTLVHGAASFDDDRKNESSLLWEDDRPRTVQVVDDEWPTYSRTVAEGYELRASPMYDVNQTDTGYVPPIIEQNKV